MRARDSTPVGAFQGWPRNGRSHVARQSARMRKRSGEIPQSRLGTHILRIVIAKSAVEKEIRVHRRRAVAGSYDRQDRLIRVPCHPIEMRPDEIDPGLSAPMPKQPRLDVRLGQGRAQQHIVLQIQLHGADVVRGAEVRRCVERAALSPDPLRAGCDHDAFAANASLCERSMSSAMLSKSRRAVSRATLFPTIASKIEPSFPSGGSYIPSSVIQHMEWFSSAEMTMLPENVGTGLPSTGCHSSSVRSTRWPGSATSRNVTWTVFFISIWPGMGVRNSIPDDSES